MDIDKLREQLFGPGPRVREYPNGRAGADDEGAGEVAVAADHKYKIIRIVFEAPMDWIGCGRESAMALRDLLTEKINELWPEEVK